MLLGASGSGKSTLLNILGGLDRSTSGEVHYRDHNLTTARDEGLTLFRREHIGFVFQFCNLIPSLTAWENVALVTEIAGNPLNSRECALPFRPGLVAFVIENHRAKRRTVEFGHRNALEAEVLRGLNAGELVIRHPGNQIKEGSRVHRADRTGGA